MFETYENTILIVDDTHSYRLTDKAIIESHFPNLTVLEAFNAQDALSLIKQHPINLALIEIYMPTMDGFELAIIYKVAIMKRISLSSF